ncbi:adenosylhomocysteine nucleosidase [Halobacillus dabanensis]|uniref:Adenosylhomocysteine nucleosidase n=1 Tax=Halobacillus dabanensis TaxID=240302 RepID=A0A1I3V947_HALDA|nr:HAD hydrolase-like protein [Halobacillus dabanensis]SFJ91519.1 adenosylhomocysteine nucleosidase [Halobacillus dabanensis]
MAHALIFDMDGTLFQTDKILEFSLEDTFNDLRSRGQWDKETPIEKYREIMGVPLPTVWDTLLPHHSEDIREHANSYFLKRLIANIREGKGALYPHVKEVFCDLKEKGCSIYIASNGLTEYLKAIIDHYQLNHWVTETFSIEQIQSLDKADLVGSILEKYRMDKAVVVGDRLSDIQAAKNNGLISVGCHFDFAKEEELSEADLIIHDLRELKTILPEIFQWE